MSEEWRLIPGYERTYRVSSLGRVESIPRPKTRGGLLSVKIGKRGYPAVSLVQDGRQTTREVHQLVALAFIGPRPEGHEVRHIDGDPARPHADNLTYGSRSDNVRDKRAHGTDHNVNKTHCPAGHPYDEVNTLRIPSRPTARYCRMCNEARKRQTAPDYDEAWRP